MFDFNYYNQSLKILDIMDIGYLCAVANGFGTDCPWVILNATI